MEEFQRARALGPLDEDDSDGEDEDDDDVGVSDSLFFYLLVYDIRKSFMVSYNLQFVQFHRTAKTRTIM